MSVASTAVLHRHPDVRYVPVVDAPPVPLLLAWPRRGEHPAIKELVRTATESVPATTRRSASWLARRCATLGW